MEWYFKGIVTFDLWSAYLIDNNNNNCKKILTKYRPKTDSVLSENAICHSQMCCIQGGGSLITYLCHNCT